MTELFRIESNRDGLIDEFHDGIFVKDWSEDTTPYYLRSCAKPLQATLLIDYGIDLSEEELALCCGSHAGEDCHIRVAKKILKKFDLDESLLKCGIHAPLSKTMQDKMLLNNEKPSQLHNNCSGKHIGFLVICKKMGWDLETYDEPSHPLQIKIKEKINTLCDINIDYPMTTDGCGVPILSMPLYNMILGYQHLLDYPKIIDAIKKYPYIFGGENRTDTEIIQNTDNLVAKVGAGGLCVVLNTNTKEAFAIKINDCSYEARRIALFECINQLGWGNLKYDKNIRTIAGKIVGEIKFEFL